MNAEHDQNDGQLNLKILYIEDEPFHELLLEYICKKYGASCIGARSLEAAEDLIAQARKPDARPFDFAIHDCRIWFDDESPKPSLRAGDTLYVKLCRAGIPVLVLSGDPVEDEPYVSNPPVLGILSKPAEEAVIDEAVRKYLAYAEKQQLDGKD